MPSDVRFADLKKQLERHGWVFVRISSSHHIFEKPGERNHLSIPVHRGMVKYTYVRQIKKAIEGGSQGAR